MPTVSPFNTPASGPSQSSADGIYYGWMGLIAQPTFIAAMANIVSTGIKTALTDPDVKSAAVSNITLGMKGYQLDADVIDVQKAVLFDSILAALDECELTVILPPKTYATQEKRAWMLLCLAAAAVRNGNFTGDESNEDFLDLLARMDNDTNLLIP